MLHASSNRASNVYQPTLITAHSKSNIVHNDTSQRRLEKFLRHDNRIFIHHPAELPISYRHARCAERHTFVGENDFVGLSFETNEPVQPQTVLDVTVRTYDEDYTFQGQVVWVRLLEQHYQLGLCFNNEGDAFRARMIEQACYIEIYRRILCEIEGCTIDIERAAKEWIDKFSAQFPKLLQNDIEVC